MYKKVFHEEGDNLAIASGWKKAVRDHWTKNVSEPVKEANLLAIALKFND
jgi:hypothetical protein